MAEKTIKIACRGADVADYKDLREFQGNLKTLPPANAAKLRKEILELGFSEPIGVWVKGAKKYILNGHQRVKVLEALASEGFSIPPIPIVYIEAKNLREAKKKVLSLTSQFGRLDIDGLREFASSAGITLKDVSDRFVLPEIDAKILMDVSHAAKDGKTGDDDAPAAGQKAIAKRGDIYQLGDHRLLCGDALEPKDLEKVMAGEKASLVFTDPPYNIDYASKNDFLNKAGKGNANQTPIKNDKIDNFPAFVGTAFAVLKPHLAPVNSVYVTSITVTGLKDLTVALGEGGFHLSELLIWVKNNIVLGRLDYFSQHEVILYGWSGKHKFYAKNKRTVWNYDKPTKSKLHPTMKPVALISEAIENSSRPGEVVLDPFGGSGSTLIACEKLGRRARLVEIDPIYVDVTVKRWEEFSGKPARKL